MKSEKNGETILNALHSILPMLHIHVFPIIHNLYWKDIRLKENQIKVLMAVRYLKKTTSTELSEGLNIAKGSLTTIIRSLVDLNIIQKEAHPDDERASWLTLTANGKKCLQFKNRHDIKKLDKLFAKLRRQDAVEIARSLDLLSSYLKEVENTDVHQ